MFYGCSSLSDIKPLQNWNVSNGNNFYDMFIRCSSISDIKPLQNWKYFKDIFDKNKYYFYNTHIILLYSNLIIIYYIYQFQIYFQNISNFVKA